MVPFFFPGLDINTYTNFEKKILSGVILATPRGICNHSWTLAITLGSLPLLVLATTREVTIEVLYTSAIFKTPLEQLQGRPFEEGIRKFCMFDFPPL